MRVDLGIPMLLSEIAYATGGRLMRNENILIKSISTDSRKIEKGDLFIAINGKKFNGGDFANEVKKRCGYVLSSNPKNSDILHPDGTCALLSFAEYYNKNLPYILYRIGITGSVGKTTTKEFLKILLEKSYVTHATEGNFNNEIGLPMSVLSAKSDTQILVMEMGMNHRGEISRLSKCLHPDIAMITNIGTAHIGNLGSREDIAQAKLEITDGMDGGFLITPDDESLLSDIQNSVKFSLTNMDSDCYLRTDTNGEILIFKRGCLYARSHFALKEEHHKKCLLAATCAAMMIGLSGDEISSGVARISYDNARQNIFFREKYYFYTDFYNASRESVLACIETAKNTEHIGGKSLILGDVLELGDMSEAIHFELGQKISTLVFKNLFLFGILIEDVKRGAIAGGFPADRIFLCKDPTNPTECAELIRRNCKEGEMIFMKASRGVRLERVLEAFKK